VPNGLSTLSQGRATLDALGWQREAAYVNVLLADVLTWSGQLLEALRLLDETLLASARSGVAAFDAALHTRRALAQSMDPRREFEASEQEYRRAIAVARDQSATLLELQACNGLGQLMLKQGRMAEAQQLIRPVYGRFSDGLHLPDLRQASELLRRSRAA
jgi:tetratricopeptide (TPR) repeat protein